MAIKWIKWRSLDKSKMTTNIQLSLFKPFIKENPNIITLAAVVDLLDIRKWFGNPQNRWRVVDWTKSIE